MRSTTTAFRIRMRNRHLYIIIWFGVKTKTKKERFDRIYCIMTPLDVTLPHLTRRQRDVFVSSQWCTLVSSDVTSSFVDVLQLAFHVVRWTPARGGWTTLRVRSSVALERPVFKRAIDIWHHQGLNNTLIIILRIVEDETVYIV